jgi:CubicO group peptidase (beta-lactamase class C family)
MLTKNSLLLCIGLSLSSICTFAQGKNTTDSIDAFIKIKMEQKHIPALQLSIVKGGEIVKNASFGTANLEYNIAASDQTIFSLNSITKAFTGVAIMQLSEAGKLKVSDPLSLYLDGLPLAWQKITLQQVLTHTAGLPDIEDENEMILGKGDEQIAMREVKKLPIKSAVGEKFSYNQTGYVLLGQIITKLSGMHFTKFIEERQFKPAGMKSTRFGDSFDVIPNSAGAYTMTRQVGEQFVRNETPGVGYIQFPVFFRTAAGILSTATDMANWIIAIKTGKLLKESKSIETMWRPAVLNNGRIGGFNRLTNGYALGWPTVTRAEHPAVAPVGGGRSTLFMYQKDDLSIVVLTNLMGSNPDQFVDEIAGYFIPDMKEANGFGLPLSLKKLRTELLKVGFDKGIIAMKNLKKKDPSFNVLEDEVNGWGYQLLAQKKTKEALCIFKLNVSLNKNSANAYDSLGEMFEVVNEKDMALLNYRKSLTLNPENRNAAGRIKALEGLE